MSDAFWARVQPLLPVHVNTHRFGGGRPRASDRDCLDAILFVLRTGCQWNALNATVLAKSSTAHDRFRQWVEAGVFLRLWKAGLQEYDEVRGLDWKWLSMDGAMTKAPLGGEKHGSQPDRPGQGRNQAERADRRLGGPRRRRRRRGQRAGLPARP